MSTSTAAQSVHRELDNFIAPGNEIFPDGCGPYAALAALHSLEPASYPFGNAQLAAIKQTMVERGWWVFENGVSGGCNVEQLANYLSEIAGYNVQYFSSYGQGGPLLLDDGSNVTALRTVLRGLAGVHPVLVEVDQGHLWPGSEAATGRHWGCVGGLDSVRGYLVAQGDILPPTGQPEWIGWNVLLASAPLAFLVVWGKRVAPPAPPDVPGAVALLHQALAKLGA